VNNLPKVVTQQCPGAESNLHPRVTSRLQVRHVTVRLPSHTVDPGGGLYTKTVDSISTHRNIVDKSVPWCHLANFRV